MMGHFAPRLYPDVMPQAIRLLSAVDSNLDSNLDSNMVNKVKTWQVLGSGVSSTPTDEQRNHL